MTVETFIISLLTEANHSLILSYVWFMQYTNRVNILSLHENCSPMFLFNVMKDLAEPLVFQQGTWGVANLYFIAWNI